MNHACEIKERLWMGAIRRAKIFTHRRVGNRERGRNQKHTELQRQYAAPAVGKLTVASDT